MKRIVWILACCLVLTSLFPQPAVLAAAPTPPPTPGHYSPWDELRERTHKITPQPPQASRPFASAQASDDDGYIYSALAYMDPWAKSVFNIFIDGNWEIYFADAGMNVDNRRRLTHNSIPDVEPRLNPGATAILYMTYAGDYDIARMDTRGGNVKALTANTANDIYPSWSPDGSRIVFSSNKGGSYDIYTMRADGSDVKRLTSSSLSDFAPTWSPDGNWIAFVHQQTLNSSLGDLYIMHPDGTEMEEVASGIPWLDNLAWSPDGNSIAFSADLHGTQGFFETWLLDLATGQTTVLAEDDNSMDNIPYGWLPDGDFLSISAMEYSQDGNGRWWLFATHVVVRSMQTASTYVNWDSGLDKSGSWASTDLKPPYADLNPLPQYSPAGNFKLSWSADDSGDSGVYRYQIETSPDGITNWTPWQTVTNANSASYTGQPGQARFFRLQAIDRASNRGEWTKPQGTRFYSYAITGSVTDNRGQPASDAAVSIDPAPWEPAVAGADGRYHAYMTGSGAVTLQTSHPGFGSLPAAKIQANADITFPQVLPPADNLVANGDFESGLDGWTPGGKLAAAKTNSERGSGTVTLGLDCGTPCWGVKEPVATGDLNYRMVADSQGGVHVLVKVHSTNGSAVDVNYYYRSPDGTWSGPVTVGSATVNHLALAIDGQDTLYALWGDDTFSMKPKDEIWSVPAPIGIVAGGWPKLIAGKTGQVYALYQCIWAACGTYPAVYAVIRDSATGAWSAPILIGSFDWNGYYFTGTVTGDGILHTFRSDKSVKYRSMNASGDLGADTTINAAAPRAAAGLKMTAANLEDGTLIASWQDSYTHQAWYSILRPGQNWSGIGILGQIPEALSISAGLDNKFHIFGYRLSKYGSPPGLYYVMLPNGYAPNPTEIPWANDLMTAFDPDGWLHVVQATSTNLDYWQSMIALPDSGESLSQEVSVPADMHQPTLSFLYKTGGTYAASTRFRVTVEANETSTEVVSATQPNSAWKHVWLDLTPWLGQTIQIRAALEHEPGAPIASAALDDVSVGSWTTPVIQSVAPAVLPNLIAAPVEMLISGENFINPVEVRIGEQSYQPELLEPTLLRIAIQPGRMRSGHLDVVVVNQDGSSARLSGAVEVTPPVYIPMVAGRS